MFRVRVILATVTIGVALVPLVQGRTLRTSAITAAAASAPVDVNLHEPIPLPVAIVSQPPIAREEQRALELERAQKTASDAQLVLWTQILGGATVLLALGTGALWWATRRLVREAEHSSERELRSYLFVEPVLDEIIVTHSGLAASKIRARITNHGKTPAVLILVRAITSLSEQPPTSLPDFPGSDAEIPNGVAVGPQFTHDVEAPVLISNQEWGRVQHLELGVYCYGRVDYEDVLGKRRQTGFCWQLRRSGGTEEFVISPGTSLNFRT
jgi:hypothetical protein